MSRLLGGNFGAIFQLLGKWFEGPSSQSRPQRDPGNGKEKMSRVPEVPGQKKAPTFVRTSIRGLGLGGLHRPQKFGATATAGWCILAHAVGLHCTAPACDPADAFDVSVGYRLAVASDAVDSASSVPATLVAHGETSTAQVVGAYAREFESDCFCHR